MSAAVDFFALETGVAFSVIRFRALPANDSERLDLATQNRCKALRNGELYSSCYALTIVGEVTTGVCRRPLMHTRHGHTNGRTTTPEYRAWRGMVARCTIPSASHYAEYGGRGITVCEEWRRSFLAFFGHVGTRPSPLHSIDRIHTEGHYEPGNVRWATREEQHRNQRSNRWLIINGERLCIADWAKRSPVSFVAITRRLDAGWDAESAVFAASQNVGPRSLRKPPAYKPWVCIQCGTLVLGRKKANAGRCENCKEAS